MIDWPALVGRLSTRLPRTVIAGLCGHSPSWVSKLCSGDIEQPGHMEGEILLRLYREKISTEISEIQKVGAFTR